MFGELSAVACAGTGANERTGGRLGKSRGAAVDRRAIHVLVLERLDVDGAARRDPGALSDEGADSRGDFSVGKRHANGEPDGSRNPLGDGRGGAFRNRTIVKSPVTLISLEGATLVEIVGVTLAVVATPVPPIGPTASACRSRRPRSPCEAGESGLLGAEWSRRA